MSPGRRARGPHDATQRPGALLLDALGTLVALEPPAPRLRRVLASGHGISITAAEAKRAIAAEITYYRAHLGDGRDASSLAALRYRCAEALRSALPAHARLHDLEQVVEVLLASIEFSVFGDVRGALESARKRGVRVIVVSNWDCSLPDVLTRAGLAPLLDGVVVSAEVGAAKPAPEIFARALAAAGVGAADAVHVGDSLREDVLGARAAGIEAVLLRRDGGPGPSGVRTVASLAELRL